MLFRERATRKQTSFTYVSRVEAKRMAAVIEANGGDLGSAQRVISAAKRGSPLVRNVVLEHISMLTAVAPGQLVRYRKPGTGPPVRPDRDDPCQAWTCG